MEGKGVIEAVGRSISLARGNVRRLMAMTLFTTFGTISALMILSMAIGFFGRTQRSQSGTIRQNGPRGTPSPAAYSDH